MSRLRKSGGYRDLRTFRSATLIYDATYWFCEKYLNPRSRTVDQMVQAARSGRQNIAEGSRAAATSSQTELRLVNVARASLEELLLDYEDFLRHRRQSQWAKDDPQAQAVRRVASDHQSDGSDLTDQQRAALYAKWLEYDDPFIRANALICLIHQTNYLLDQQIAALEKQFIEEGGYSEQLASKRLKHRSDQTDRSSFPPCPQCGKPMVLRTAKTGQNAGKQFLGCSGYPDCKGAKNL
jgi:four helix bundle suffix protein